MNLAANESITSRNKHIDIMYHFVRQVIAERKDILGYVPTTGMVADMLTNPSVASSLKGWDICVESVARENSEILKYGEMLEHPRCAHKHS